ncbi:unnamed protein product, partial [Ilex paraguariensis]
TGSDGLPFRSAFKNVIFRRSLHLDIERPLAVIQNKLDQEVIVQFKVCCPNVGEETSIYVIGNALKLGLWKVQDGLELNYAGESMWQADCVMQKDDFPIKYPFGCLLFHIIQHYEYCLLNGIWLLYLSVSIFLNSSFTYKYSKYGKAGNFSLETGPNRELFVDFSSSQPKCIIVSDGMMRVRC